VFERLDEMVAALVSSAREGDHVIAMSNGSFGGVHEKILAALRERPTPAGGNFE